MADIFQKSAEFVARNLKESMSTPVVYTRGAQSGTIPAIVGGKRRVPDDTDGVIVNTVEVQFQVLAADLSVFGFSPPALGDTITYSGQTFEAMPDDLGSVYQSVDPYDTIYSIKTKKVV